VQAAYWLLSSGAIITLVQSGEKVSNHSPLFPLRTGREEEGENTQLLTSLQHFHRPIPLTQTHKGRKSSTII